MIACERRSVDEIIVDNFAGGGGASTGIEMALGRSPDVAVNHNEVAIAIHKANHPHTRHYIKDVFEVDPIIACRNRPVGAAWFSPDCKHFSKAKGGAPVSKRVRGLAWVVVKWASLPKNIRPRVLFLENVEEFQTWGPLIPKLNALGEKNIGSNGKPFMIPCPARKGSTFRKWVSKLRRLGYQIEWKELRACDYGAPTIRKRLFVIARCDGKKIVWPKPTHGKPTHPDVIAGRLKPWRTAAEIIDWSIPCPSIFMTRDESRLYRKDTGTTVVRPLANATMKRIFNGVKKYVIEADTPFIVSYYGRDDFRGQPLTDPLRTQTTENRFGLVSPFTVPRYGEAPTQEPRCRSIEEPLPTVVTTGNGASLVAAHLQQMYSRSVGHSTDTPAGTVNTKNKSALVTASISRIGQQGGQGKYAYSVEEPLTTITTKQEHLLVNGQIMQVNHQGDRRNQELTEPLHTVTGERRSHALCAAWIAKHFGGMTGVSAETPFPTITTRGTQNQISAAFLSHQYTSNTGGGSGDQTAPLKTITAGGQHHVQVMAFLQKYYGNGEASNEQNVQDPLHTVTTKERFGIVKVHGVDFQIVDIGMRMLTPRELFRAQGFPDSYVIDPPIKDKFGRWKPMPKSAQVSACGNSVCPDLAAALIQANVPELKAKKKHAVRQREFVEI